MTVADMFLIKAPESDLDRILRVLDVDSTGMSYEQKKNAVVLNFTDLDGWYFNETIYEFQVNEIINIRLTADQVEEDREEYAEWVELHNQLRVQAKAAAISQGFTYSYDGKLIEPHTGTITGVVASSIKKAREINITGSGTEVMRQRAQSAAMVNDMISEQQTDNDEGYNMNFNGVDDPILILSKFTFGSVAVDKKPVSTAFTWDLDSIYNYVFLYSDTEKEDVVISDLSPSDVAGYINQDWFKTIMLSNAVAKYKEKNVHGRLWSSKRMNQASKDRLLDLKDYIILMGDKVLPDE